MVDYHSKIPYSKRTRGLSSEQLVTCCEMVSAEDGLPNKIISDAETNFISDDFKDFCKKPNIYHGISLLYNHQSSEQVGVYVKFVKRAIYKCFMLIKT